MKREFECVVVGGGPGGASLAAALQRRGLDVLCVTPRLDWRPTYGVWVDELAGLPYAVPLSHRWEQARVSCGADASQLLSRSYGRIDTDQLPSVFFEPLRAEDALILDRVNSVSYLDGFFSVQLAASGDVQARFVFDATGHEPRFLERPMGQPAFQTAFGKLVRTSFGGLPLSCKTMGLMLWDDGLQIEEANSLIPAFVYVMPLTEELAFVEMTVLASRPAVPVGKLETLLDGWLDQHGMKSVGTGGEVERVFIPMGHSLPSFDQPLIGIGGAASEVHPATGYMIARTLRTAERLADAVVRVRHETADAAKNELWRAVWSVEERRARQLYMFGLEALLQLTPEQTYDFFQAFFELPSHQWEGYLSMHLSPTELAATMWALFQRVSPSLRLRLAAASLGRHTPSLARAIFGSAR